MLSDGSAGFEELYRSGPIREIAYMAQVGRKFVDIHRSQGSPIAEDTIGRIAQLYAVEKEAKRSFQITAPHAAPVLVDLERRLAMQLTMLLGQSPQAGAIRYDQTRMERSRPNLDHGILKLDNN